MAIQRVEFARRQAAFGRASSRGCGIVVACFVAACLPIPFLPDDVWSGKRGPALEALTVIYVLALVGAFWGSLFLHVRRAARARRDLDLRCPGCHRDFDISVAMASGRCSWCNATVVKGDPDLPAGRQWQPIQRPDMESRRRRFMRAQTTMIFVIVASMYLFVLGYHMREDLSRWNSTHPGSPTTGAVNALDIAAMAVIGLTIALLAWFTRWSPRHYGLVCPDCGASLETRAGSLTMATGRCGRCGAMVVEGEPALRDESQRQAAVVRERRCFRWVVTVGLLVLVLLVCLTIATVICSKRPGNALPDWFWPVARSFLCSSVSFVTVMGVIFAFSFYPRRSGAPRCPNCQAPVVNRMKQLATVTGRCGRCGAVVVEGAPAPPITKTD